jgi:transposase
MSLRCWRRDREVSGGSGAKINVGKACELLDRISVVDEVARYRILIAREVVGDVARLDATLTPSNRWIAGVVTASGTSLTDIDGVGPYGPATIIGYTKDIIRFPTKGHYATYNATAPIEVSSAGNTRHRLNTRGNRRLNHAIHIAAVTNSVTTPQAASTTTARSPKAKQARKPSGR